MLSVRAKGSWTYEAQDCSVKRKKRLKELKYCLTTAAAKSA